MNNKVDNKNNYFEKLILFTWHKKNEERNDKGFKEIHNDYGRNFTTIISIVVKESKL